MSRKWVSLGLAILWLVTGIFVLVANCVNPITYFCVWMVLVTNFVLDTIREWF